MVCFGTRRVGRSSSALCTVHHYLQAPHPSGDQKARCSLRTTQASARLGTGAHCARVYCRTDGPFARHLPRIAARLVWAKRGRGVARAPQLGLGTAARPTEGIFGISKCTPTGGKHVPVAFASSTTAAAALSGVTQRWKFGSSHPSEGCCPSEALRGSWRWRHLDGQREKCQEMQRPVEDGHVPRSHECKTHAPRCVVCGGPSTQQLALTFLLPLRFGRLASAKTRSQARIGRHAFSPSYLTTLPWICPTWTPSIGTPSGSR